MIRDATSDDIPRLLEMGAQFFGAAKLIEPGSYDPETARKTCEHLIRDDSGILLICETGMIGGLVFPSYMTGELTAQEFFWWDSGGAGLALLKAFEEIARGLGAKSVSMIALETLYPERVARIYQKAGYALRERSYMKVM